jgi:D-ribulokinase
MSVGTLHLGIDIGTQGVRVVAATSDGEVVARAAHPLVVPPDGPVQEQDPAEWWAAVVAAMGDLGEHRASVVSLAISCTSGSVCAVDGEGIAVGPGLLYADRRGIAAQGTDASWASAKLAWLAAERPEVVARAERFTSPGGYVAGRLLGRPAAIDVTQALKFGYDPEVGRWGALAVPATALPEVVATGFPLGPVTPEAAVATGLPPAVVVVAGATDGVAGQLACRPSPTRWAVAIGSTIVWKAVSTVRIDALDQGVYSHRGPDGVWFPGAASNAGARVLAGWATPAELEGFDGSVPVTPSTPAAYPSAIRGERFPFVDPDFEPWLPPEPAGPARYAAEVLGVAFVERWGCEALVGRGCEPPTTIATTGGAVASTSWTQLRADVMQVPIEVPAEASSAFGTAVIAAGTAHGGVLAAGEAMVRVARRVEPDPDAVGRWDDPYRRFQQRCTQHREGVS